MAPRLSLPQGSRPSNGRWRAVAAGVAATGLIASALGAWALYSYAASQHQQAVSSELNSARSVLAPSLGRDNELLDAVAAMVGVNPGMTNRELQEILRRLDTTADGGPLSFVYVARVSPAAVPAFERAAQADPPLGIPVAGRLGPVSSSLGYCLTRLAVVELPSSSQSLLSALAPYLSPWADYCATRLRPLLEASARTGTTSVALLSALLSTMPDNLTGPSGLRAMFAHFDYFLAIEPVYRTSPPPPTLAGREHQLLGWVIADFDASQILAPFAWKGGAVAVTLEHANQGGAAQVVATVGTLQGRSSALLRLPNQPGWVAEVTARPVAGLDPAAQGLAVFAAGAAMTALLASAVWVLVRSRRSALEAVAAATVELRHQALHDALTGLPNRAFIAERSLDLLARASSGGDPVAVFLIDLDDFKKVNDTLGHGAGDELLRAAALRLRHAVRASDTIGRLGGDEFVVLVGPPSLEEGVDVIAHRLQAAMSQPFHIGPEGTRFSLSASIGVAVGVDCSPDELLRDADIAMYRAKDLGKGCHVLFGPEMDRAEKAKAALEAELRSAVLRDEFVVLYQPVVDLGSGERRGVEAQLNWRHPERGLLAAEAFEDALDNTELALEVGRSLLRQACLRTKSWQNLDPGLTVSLKISPHQFYCDQLVDDVSEALQLAGLEPCNLRLEVPEAALMEDARAAPRRLQGLSALGVRVGVDYFGTGYSSLAYLEGLRADVLRIDGSFLARVGPQEEDSLLDAIVHLGKSLGFVLAAEGVADEAQLARLRAAGCDLGQGPLFSRPLTAELFDAQLRGHAPNVVTTVA